MPTLPEWDEIDPSDVLNIALDFTNLLDGETITGTPTWSVSPSGLTLGSQSNTTTKATIRVSTAAVNVTYTVTCTVASSGGQTFQRSALLKGANR